MRLDFYRFILAKTRRPIVRTLAGALVLLPGAGALFSGCTQAQTDSVSPSYVIINSLEAASGASPNDFDNTLGSDVVTFGGVIEDIGFANFRLALKDPGAVNTPLSPSTTNRITLTRYHVRYVRSDGRNTPGVHVPYPFDGGMTVTVDPPGVTGTFILVRVQAKLEAPLLGLRDLGGAVAISTLAEVTFYGHDQAGREVSVAGTISVNFADWADPD